MGSSVWRGILLLIDRDFIRHVAGHQVSLNLEAHSLLLLLLLGLLRISGGKWAAAAASLTSIALLPSELHHVQEAATSATVLLRCRLSPGGRARGRRFAFRNERNSASEALEILRGATLALLLGRG